MQAFGFLSYAANRWEKNAITRIGNKILRHFCKHYLSLHLKISSLEAWITWGFICAVFGYWFTVYFDTGSGLTHQKYCMSTSALRPWLWQEVVAT